ncbi:MAG: ABC transporter permease, partial [Acidobacteriota bacterium]
MDDLPRDLRLAVRQLRRQPGFAAVVVLTLALGIGATTALFGVVHGVLLEPLGFRDEDRLVRLVAVDRVGDDPRNGFCAPDLWHFEERLRAAETVGYWAGQTMTLEEPGQVRQLYGQYVSWDLFETLGAEPVLGRGFAASDVVPGRGHVALLSAATWRRVWNEDRGVIGRTISLDGVATTVLGVLPDGIDFP